MNVSEDVSRVFHKNGNAELRRYYASAESWRRIYSGEPEWKTVKKSGCCFDYNTSASFMLDVLVEKLTGKKFLEYMRPELDAIGVSKDIFCVESPDGYSWGGSGVCSTTRDFAKFAELIMHRGNCKESNFSHTIIF